MTNQPIIDFSAYENDPLRDVSINVYAARSIARTLSG